MGTLDIRNDGQIALLINNVKNFEREIKDAESRIAKIKETILDKMVENNLMEIKVGGVKIRVIAPTKKSLSSFAETYLADNNLLNEYTINVIDEKRVMETFPHLIDQLQMKPYIKISEVKE